MISLRIVATAFGLVVGSVTLASASLVLFPVGSYLSSTDSPLVAGAGEQRVIHPFEAQALGPLAIPGITTSHGLDGTPLFVIGSGANTDSVDADDGAVDGFGRQGRSLGHGANLASGNLGFVVTFDPVVLGSLPTSVGVVWTDGDDLARAVVMDFFDVSGALLGSLTTDALGDSGFDGRTGEDRFLGGSFAGGIGSFRLRQPGSDNGLEIDHLQFVVAIPEPSLLVPSIGLAMLVVVARRGRR